MTDSKITVTKVFLPPIEEYQNLLAGVWERGHITNHGPLVLELEEKLRQRTGVPHVFYLSNGTVALQIAIKALGLTGEIITTPFSYVATTSSIVWEQCKPVYVDIDPDTMTIDPDKIEAAITPQTTGILATHVYGNPCDVIAIEAIAKKHGLKVIYDAAHAFDVQFEGKSLLTYGDVSTLSFHATKLFHTTEGGAVVSMDADVAAKLSYMRNFGHNGSEEYWGVGINGKNSELHAAMGLSVLPYVNDIIAYRKQIFGWYDEAFADLLEKGMLRKPTIRKGTDYNYAYYPVVFPSEAALLATIPVLEKNNIYGRRYFYPSLNTIDYTEGASMPVSEDIAKRVFCLPLFYGLEKEHVDQITSIIVEALS